MERLICFAIGYAFGNFPTGYLYAKLHGVDITTKGSGNVGTTNVLRNLGPKAGIITMLGDFLKTFLPLFITAYLFRSETELRYVLTLYAGFGAIMGHNFPVTLKFRGGKGVACTAALIIYSDPIIFAVSAVVFFVCVGLTRFVSFASIVVACLYFILTAVLVASGHTFGWGGTLTFAPQYRIEVLLLALLIAGMIIIQHRSNIERLLHGTENKLSFGGKLK